VRGTIEAIERELVEGDFVLRYRTADTGEVDGLTGREGAFLACSFWLADCFALLGRDHDARKLLDRLLDLRNDLGLLSEEYDAVAGRLVGNFPQAFSHVSLVNSAAKVTGHTKPSADNVFLGLARQAMTGARPTGMARRHMSAAVGVAGLRELAARPGARSPTRRSGVTTTRPTKKQSVQREVSRKQAAPAKQAAATKAAAKKSATKAAKKSQATRKAQATKAANKKAPATKAATKTGPAKQASPAEQAVSARATAPTRAAGRTPPPTGRG
jgi:hypothetical protein